MIKLHIKLLKVLFCFTYEVTRGQKVTNSDGKLKFRDVCIQRVNIPTWRKVLAGNGFQSVE